MSSFVKKYKVALAEIFLAHKIERAYLFGSAVREELAQESDLDFLICFKDDLTDPLEKGQLWWGLHDSLRKFFGREVDLVTENSLKNPYFIEELNSTKQLIYGS